ncbi:17969_t:CDS:2 [Entrophospora sp. SA101]|nr:15555_t:CDS:2 [Entrophospora sp. SA101]CAJ0823147.1 17969_t:CDS:2 [Entrophospora sp. SA101]
MAGKTNISGSSSNKRTAVTATGTTLLPLTRVKRIIKEEPEVLGCGPESTFLIANIVKEVDNLKFLKEIIPQTYSLEAALQKSEKIRRNLSRHNAKLNSEDASGDSNNSDEESDKSDDRGGHL